MATKAVPMQPAINIRVFRNGDEFYSGKRFVISTRTTKDFDSFLNEVTRGLKASFGAVRKLHTPVNGHKIVDLSALENNNIYVAAGSEKFKRKPYNERNALSPRRLAAGTVKASTFAGPIQPVFHSKIRRSARIRHIYVGTKSIFIYRNGDDKELPIRLLLRYRSLQNFETVLTEINVKVNLLNGVAVRRLYKMTGERVMDCSQIECDGKYVAAGTERFKKVGYGQWEPSVLLSPRHVKKPLPPIKSKPPPQQKSSLPVKPKPTTVKKQRTDKKKKRPEKSPEQKEADSVFHHKPTTVKRSREKDKLPNYNEDPDAVFFAKDGNSETDDAKEVEDTRETAVDLPIDQIAAEEVDEEIGVDLPLNHEAKSPEPYRQHSPERKPTSPADEIPEDYSERPDEKPTDLVVDNDIEKEKETNINTNNAGNENVSSYEEQTFREEREENNNPGPRQIREGTFNEPDFKSPGNNGKGEQPTDQHSGDTSQGKEFTNQHSFPTTNKEESPGQDSNTTTNKEFPVEESNAATNNEGFPIGNSNSTTNNEESRGQDSNATTNKEFPVEESNAATNNEGFPIGNSNSTTNNEESPGQDSNATTNNQDSHSSSKDNSPDKNANTSQDIANRKDEDTRQEGSNTPSRQESRTEQEQPTGKREHQDT